MSVIVTNAKNRIAYSVVRSLGKKGVKVYTSDFSKRSMSFYSKYSCGHFIYPSPFRYPKEFIDVLIDMIKKLECKVLIPVYEETFVISKYQDILANYVSIVVPEYRSILSVHDKGSLYAIANRLGIAVPQTASIGDIKKDNSIVRNIRFPALLKPRQGGGAWGFARVRDAEHLRTIINFNQYPQGLEEDRFLIQEIIDGEVFCCGMLFNKGIYRAGHCYKQLRETPISGGTATFRESVVQPEIMQNLRKLLEHLDWHGVCQADFIMERRTGTPLLIDVNPRLWGGLFQAIVSGVDFPYLLYKMAVNGDIEPVFGYETRSKTRWIWGDLKCFIEHVSHPLTRTGISLRDFFKIDKNERFDDFDVTDPLPFFMWFVDYVNKIIKQRTFKPSPHDSLEGIWE